MSRTSRIRTCRRHNIVSLEAVACSLQGRAFRVRTPLPPAFDSYYFSICWTFLVFSFSNLLVKKHVYNRTSPPLFCWLCWLYGLGRTHPPTSVYVPTTAPVFRPDKRNVSIIGYTDMHFLDFELRHLLTIGCNWQNYKA